MANDGQADNLKFENNDGDYLGYLKLDHLVNQCLELIFITKQLRGAYQYLVHSLIILIIRKRKKMVQY